MRAQEEKKKKNLTVYAINSPKHVFFPWFILFFWYLLLCCDGTFLYSVLWNECFSRYIFFPPHCWEDKQCYRAENVCVSYVYNKVLANWHTFKPLCCRWNDAISWLRLANFWMRLYFFLLIYYWAHALYFNGGDHFKVKSF